MWFLGRTQYLNVDKLCWVWNASAAKDSYEALWGGIYFEVHLGLKIEKKLAPSLLILFVNNNSLLKKKIKKEYIAFLKISG